VGITNDNTQTFKLFAFCPINKVFCNIYFYRVIFWVIKDFEISQSLLAASASCERSLDFTKIFARLSIGVKCGTEYGKYALVRTLRKYRIEYTHKPAMFLQIIFCPPRVGFCNFNVIFWLLLPF